MPIPILSTGLKVSKKSYEDIDEDTVRRALAEQTKLLADAGFELTPYLIDPENPSALDEFKELLRSKQWKVVGIGFGVRGDSEMSPYFENLVNAVLEIVSPPPKMVFPVGPGNLMTAVERQFSTS